MEWMIFGGVGHTPTPGVARSGRPARTAVVGRVESCSGDHLIVAQGRRRITVSNDTIDHLQVRVRQRDYRWWGLIAGVAAGAAVGAANDRHAR
ncbi:MAG TPA: hypothetical protein VK886_16315 [Vicinamibacterales bacterium]|nr:hypothetical protein [Vicinamibacterales bacterium]